ncbi:MAG: transporter ATP-binding protein, partial [Rhizobacter sp.]|nr:transporter ATP-binding protein [Rhizobacter sp.]
ELSFDVLPGQRWVVLGPNGAGKSTLLSVLAGLLAPTAGTVTLNGKPLAEWPMQALADWRAWCPQFWIDPFAATVRETVLLARGRSDRWGMAAWFDGATDEHDERLRLVLDRLDLASLVDADVRQLSGGERQRDAIATAMLQDAPLLLLDEPTAHLDLSHQQRLLGLLELHSQAGGAVVMPMHDLNLAWDAATHVLLIGPAGVVTGRREQVMTPALLSGAFGVSIDRVELGATRRFWVERSKKDVS